MKPSSKKTVQTAGGKVRIRMYRHGLGDCFLLRFPSTSGKPYHVVIDSGVLLGTANATLKMSAVAEDIEKETEGKINALVVTHEHWDHVSGFTEAKEVWQRMKIAEIWLSWAENPKDALAKKLREEREERKNAIQARITALSENKGFSLDTVRKDRINGLMGFLGFDLSAAGNSMGATKAALDFITAHATKRIYHQPGTIVTNKEVPDLRIYVLGPPKDSAKLKRSNPSKAHPEVYSDPGVAFSFSGGDAMPDDDEDRPFANCAGLLVNDAQSYENHFKGLFPDLTDPQWRQLQYSDATELEHLALALDGDTNNTSLVLAFEYGGKVLLFCGDAQVGNWLSWQDYTWNVGRTVVTAKDLMANTVFYKVGHHGSHNATLKEFGLELMNHADLVAAIPVEQAMAQKKNWKMPFKPLYHRLQEKTNGRVVLSDPGGLVSETRKLAESTAVEEPNLKGKVSVGELYVDFSL